MNYPHCDFCLLVICLDHLVCWAGMPVLPEEGDATPGSQAVRRVLAMEGLSDEEMEEGHMSSPIPQGEHLTTTRQGILTCAICCLAIAWLDLLQRMALHASAL